MSNRRLLSAGSASFLLLLAACGENDNTVADLTNSGGNEASAGTDSGGSSPEAGSNAGGTASGGSGRSGGSGTGGVRTGGTGGVRTGGTGGLATGGAGGAHTGGTGGLATGGAGGVATGGNAEVAIGGDGGVATGSNAGASTGGNGGVVMGGAGGVATGGNAGIATGGSGGGVTGGTGGADDCQRVPQQDIFCKNLHDPPLAFFCLGMGPSEACVMVNPIDSGSSYCCPDEYPTCPDTAPAEDDPCSGSLRCTWGSHPDPSCRVEGECSGGAWHLFAIDAACVDDILPSDCPELSESLADQACAPHDLRCNYPTGERCYCDNCTVEDAWYDATEDTWRCWDPPASPCPAFLPNYGSVCELPVGTSCRYDCQHIADCTAEGIWAPGTVMCSDA
ncbi:MAG: hypothetical protein JW751_20350 [Polyangiaceae bacterium]|nr:hypothetical protein [Polyangiaceae bacterium]